jgi:membrane fusion protein (multidrug efflux system)
MRSRSLLAAVITAALTLLAACAEKKEAPPPPPPDVEVAQVIQRDVPVYIEAIGQTRGSQEVEIRARIEGVLESVNFDEGTYVRKGQLLYTIDPREYEAAVDQAKGRLAQAQADLARYEQDVARYRPLVEQNALPKQNLDTAVAQANAGRANVEAAQAGVTTADLNLSYTKIYAPTEGIVGKTEINVGNLVGRGASTLLTQISKVDPIRLRVSISEREYLQFARRPAETGRAANEAAAAGAPFEMILADGSLHKYGGRLAFADRLVDPTTGTLLIDIAFPNPDRLVRPGQYGRARVAVDFRRNAILVPQKAVSTLQDIDNVSVVTADNKVETRQVRTGARVGTLWVIESGLNPGDRVIVEGVQKVRPGMTVKPTVVEIKETPEAPAGTPAGA